MFLYQKIGSFGQMLYLPFIRNKSVSNVLQRTLKPFVESFDLLTPLSDHFSFELQALCDYQCVVNPKLLLQLRNTSIVNGI